METMEAQPLVVYCTCPDLTCANSLAETLVNERLAACVNVLPSVLSIYRWEGAIHRDHEVLLIIKTHSAIYPALEARIAELHPYSVPEIIALPPQAGAANCLRWIMENAGDVI